ncbi:MAG: hypothetical protein ABI623_07880, partial [bacterium]
MKLQVGVIGQSPMWEQLLAQEGVPFQFIPSGRIDDGYAVVIVNRVMSRDELLQVEKYLSGGGAILGFAGHLDGVSGTASRRERVDYLLADHDEIFPDVQLLDLSVEGEIPREANCLRTQANTFGVFAGSLNGGYAVILPFDPVDAMTDIRVANKSFYALRERLPSERISAVGKGEVRHLLHRAFEYLFRMRNLPYVHLWYYPNGMKNLFCFRIDTDGGSREEVDQLYHIALEYDIGMSWFVDVKSHEEWLQHFAFLTKQEIGVHCYEHLTFEDYDANLKNISKAKAKLQQVGLSSKGFAAPFGIWNPALARAIDKMAFDYSSEFSYLYDSFPLYPSHGTETFLTLQVPIHPICIGSLKKVGYTETQMKEYFIRVIDEKLLRDEPLFFYHHPTHHCWGVVRAMFRYVEEKQIDNTTMIDYSRWWLKRLNHSVTVVLNGDTLSVTRKKSHADSIWLHVVRPDGSEAFLEPGESIDMNAVQWSSKRKTFSPPADIRRIREFDPRKTLGDLFTSMTR